MQNRSRHRFALPRWLSKSGHKPAVKSRVLFVVIAPLLAIILVNAFLAAMLEGVVYPGISVAGTDISGLTRSQAYQRLAAQPLGRRFEIKVGEKSFAATNQDLGAEYNIAATIDLAYAIGRNYNLPIIGLFTAAKEGQLAFSYQLDFQKLQKFTTSVVSSVGQPATNAVIKIENGQILTVPDQNGLALDRAKVTQLVSDSLARASDATFALTPETVEAPIQVDETVQTKDEANNLLNLSYNLNYGGKVYSPNRQVKGYWLEIAPDNQNLNARLIVKINEQQVRGYVQSIANEININPVNKKVRIANGVSSVDREGKDGIALNQDQAVVTLMRALEARQSTDITLTTSPVAYKTETIKTVSLDASRYIEVNLSSQRLWAYQDKQVVLSSPITSGAAGAGLGTATGLFAIYYKTTNTYLNGRPYGYNYNVFVKYWMPFYKGYGLHDASWRSSFGGADYFYGGSHGCVNLPEASAAFLYSWAEVGTPVWVHN